MLDLSLYQKGAGAWLEDEEQGWIGAEITERTVDDNGLHLVLIDSKKRKHRIDAPLNGPLPPLKNPPMLDGVDDLTNLSYLHEPGVLHNLKQRYAQEIIYSYSGIVLIAMNPFTRCELYTPEIAKAYIGKRKGELEPHIFAVAEDAYRCMVDYNRNQSIIVSGESGAGKTISAKYIMRYFAAVGKFDSEDAALSSNLSIDHLASSDGADMHGPSTTGVENQVLATNPIMEAFGNAKTMRNDNSSRFGKFIEIQFDHRQSIAGANIHTFLLERSRVVFQPLSERNYHIFYRLCAGVPSAERAEFALDDYSTFHYLNQGGQGKIEDVDDAEMFAATVRAFSTIGLSVNVQWQIFQLLAAILHLGNIVVKTNRPEQCTIDADCIALDHASRLLGVPTNSMRKWLTFKKINAAGEVVISPLDLNTAIATRDAIAKYIYHMLFEWLVQTINATLKARNEEDVSNFIAVLDIYGFEHFAKNSFEQLCINFANEKLQQEFNLHVFKLEQEEYVREKINWSFIDYADNQPCIELIEARMGILDLLDEQCRLPSGTDATFVAKLYSELASPAKPHPNFQKARFGEKSFTIKHYATPVEYDAEGFLDKNRDTLPEEIITMLKESTFDFAAELFDKVEVAVGDMVEMGSPTAAAKRSRSIMAGSQTDLLGGPKGAAGRGGLGGGASVASVMNLQAPTSPTGGVYSSAMSLLAPKPSAMKTASSMAALSSNANLLGRGGARKKPIKPTLSSVFKESLRKLMDTINFTNVHYIRCLKPSPTMKPFQIDNLYTLQQLRACGVLETIRISCAGYPGRYGFSEFAERYRLLDTVAQPIVDARMAAKQILQSIVTDMDKYQVGETKIFLRAGLVAYLEKRRADELNRVVTLIQKRVRGYLARKRYLRKRNAIIRIQRGMGYRAHLRRKRARELRERQACICIQRHWRGYCARQSYKRKRQLVISLQAYIRRLLVVRRLQAKRKERAAVTIQRIYRGHRQRTAYESTLRFIIIVQSLARRRRARAVARRLKMEAKSVAHFKHKTGALEKKLFELTQVLAAKESHTEKISEKMATLEMQVRASKEKMEKMEAKRHAVELHAQRKVNDLEGHVQRLDDHKSKLERELAETAKLAKAREEQIKKTRKLAEALQAENQRLLEKQQQDDRRQEYQEKLAAIAADNAALKEKLAMLYKTASQTYRGRQSSPADSPSVARSRGSTERRTSVQRSPSASSLRKESPRNGRVVDSKTANVSAADPVQPPRIVMNGTSRASTHTNLLTVTAGSPRLPGSKAATGGHPTSPVVTHPEVIELLNDPALDGELAAVVGAATVMPREDLEFGQKRTREEGLCPAHLVALCVVQAWRFELSERVRVLLSHNTQAVQNLINFSNMGSPSYWMANLLELVAILETAQNERDRQQSQRNIHRTSTDTERVVTKFRHDLEYIVIEIYYQWLKELKKEVGKMVVPAVVEHQGLPGFIEDDRGGSAGFLNKLIGSSSGSPMPTEKLLAWLSRLLTVMEYNLVDTTIQRQVITVLVKYISTYAFNHMIMRKGFCTWRRGMQVQYNVTRIEEWCTKNGVAEATLHLEPLMQAAKLLQLNKAHVDDVDVMFDVCFLLSPTQIKKLLMVFRPAEFEAPVPPEIFAAIAERSVDDQDKSFLLEQSDETPFTFPGKTEVHKIGRFVPTLVDRELVVLRKVAEL